MAAFIHQRGFKAIRQVKSRFRLRQEYAVRAGLPPRRDPDQQRGMPSLVALVLRVRRAEGGGGEVGEALLGDE